MDKILSNDTIKKDLLYFGTYRIRQRVENHHMCMEGKKMGEAKSLIFNCRYVFDNIGPSIHNGRLNLTELSHRPTTVLLSFCVDGAIMVAKLKLII